MVISTLSGLIFFGIGIYLEFIILPLNLFMTIGTQQGNYDLFIYIIMAMSAFFNIIYGLVLLTLTQRQKRFFRHLGNKCCKKRQSAQPKKTAVQAGEDMVAISRMTTAQKRLAIENLVEGLQKEEEISLSEELMERILNPNRNFLMCVCMFNNMSFLPSMTLDGFYYTSYPNIDILPIYQGTFCRSVIANMIFLVRITYFVQMGTFFFMLVCMLFFCCEGCIVESWLPEFKGTYDEN